MNIIEEINTFLQRGRAPKVKELVVLALEEGIDASVILEDGLLSAMSVVGERFKRNEVFVPEVLVAARAMNAGIEILKPKLAAAGSLVKGKAVIGTVKGDLHDIGKNLVKLMIEGKGIEVIDLGVDVPCEKFIESAKEHNADIICLSALLTTTMNEMKNVVDMAESSGIRENVKIMIGGAPITEAFCESINADYYSADAASAADIALKICSSK